MRTVGFLLATFFCPIFLNAATFGPEVATARQQFFSAFGAQTASSVACGNDSCVALWVESDWTRHGLYASVIDANGNVQPASSILVRAGEEADAAIVWTGDHYLATWYDLGGTGFSVAPLSRDGHVSGAVQTFTTYVDTWGGASLAWNGRHAFAVFNTPAGDLWATVLDANGKVVRQMALPTFNAAQWTVAAAGTVFGVVWIESFQSTSTVKFRRYGDDGSPLDQDPITLAQNFPIALTKAGIAGNATQFGVAYAPAVDSTIYRLRVDASSGAIERLPVVSFVRQLSGVYWSGDDFVAYGADGNTIASERFSSGGVRALSVTSNSVSDARVVSSPTGAVAVWTDTRFDFLTQHVFGSLLDDDATAIVKGSLRVSVSALPQTKPALAASTQGALLAWSQPHDRSTADVMVQRVNNAGDPIDDVPVTLATGAGTESGPAAVWLGNAYLVVWKSNSDLILGKRVSASGVVLDANPIELGRGYRAVLTTNGTVSVLAFLRSEGVAVVRLNANGDLIDSQPISITSNVGSAIEAASNGNEFVVVWMEGVNDPFDPSEGTRPDIFAVRLSSSGQPIDTAPIAIADSAGADYDPAIGSDGRDFLIAYNDDGKLVAKRLLAEGSLAGTTSRDEGILVDANGGNTPAIGWTGVRYVIAWSVLDAEGTTVASTTLDRNGVPLDVPRAIGRSDSLMDVEGAVASTPGGAVIAYPRADAADTGIPRMYTRQVLDESPRGRGVRH